MFAKALVRKNSITAILLLVVLLVIMAVPASGQAIGITERVSVTSNGGQGNGDSSTPSISADGRYVAFGSTANNLVTGDTNGYGDNFVHDRQTGQTILTSVASNGTQGNDWSSGHPVISADGRYVAFSSNASNLVIGDTNGYADVFVHDLQSRQTTRVSVSSNGTQGNNDSWMPSISADGRYVIFPSTTGKPVKLPWPQSRLMEVNQMGLLTTPPSLQMGDS
jgi:Tol biopolymer transport system component